jgi:hypothetical protein
VKKTRASGQKRKTRERQEKQQRDRNLGMCNNTQRNLKRKLSQKKLPPTQVRQNPRESGDIEFFLAKMDFR